MVDWSYTEEIPCKYRDMPMLYKHRDFTSTEACADRKTENQVCMIVVVGRTDFLWLEYAPMFGKTVLIHWKYWNVSIILSKNTLFSVNNLF